MELHAIDWKSLEHAYGSAEDIPELLQEAEKHLNLTE